MKRLDVLETIIDEAESVIPDIPVHTWKGAPSRQVPVILVDDNGHSPISQNNTSRNGGVEDDSGNFVGEERVKAMEGKPELVVRHGHETESIRLIGQLNDHFERFEDYPQEFGSNPNEVLSFSVGEEYPRKIDVQMADRVFQQAFKLEIEYLDTKTETEFNAEPIENFNNDINQDI